MRPHSVVLKFFMNKQFPGIYWGLEAYSDLASQGQNFIHYISGHKVHQRQADIQMFH